MRANGARVAVDHQTTLVAVLELSGSSWMNAGQIPGVERTAKSKIEPSAPAVLKVLEGWVRRARAAGKTVSRTVLAYEIGRDGFWLARLLAARSEEHTSELQSRQYLVCRLLLEKNTLISCSPHNRCRR